MPITEIEALSKGSSEAQTKAAISACIAAEIRAGTDPDQAKGMCHGMARDKGAPVSAPKGEG